MGLTCLAPASKSLKSVSTTILAAVGIFSMSLSHAILTPENSITFSAGPQRQATISVINKDVVAKINNVGSQVLIKNISAVPEYARDLWIDDFNFDGKLDVAITQKVDPESQDQFYTIFTWDNGLEHFIPLPFQNRLSNLELDPSRKEIRSSYKTGEFWTEDTYRFNNGQAYLYSKSELLTIDLWHTMTFGRNGQIIKSLVSADGRLDSPPQPVSMSVITDSAPLYSEPLPSTRLPLDIPHGQGVTLVDFKHGENGLHWVFVRSGQQANFMQGWILLSNLLTINEQ